jgi:hypothetical protein
MGPAPEIYGYCHRRGRPRRLDNRRDARARQHFGHPDRIDPGPVYPPDFRVEKLSGHEQFERFRKTGLAEAALRSATYNGENWIARFGYLLDRKAFNFRSVSIDNGIYWRAQRGARFLAWFGDGILRRLGHRLGAELRAQSSSSSLSPSA